MKDTYAATLDYLYSQLPMYQREGQSAYKENLTNIRVLCAALDHPQERFPSIHLAGTNGKGSTAHLLSAVLQAHGYRTGLHTSPHYRDFRERIKVDGELIPPQAVVGFVEDHRSLFERLQPSFFEISVALAFHHFAQEDVDVAIIETGLGGRLDSTNILNPQLSIITNISWDHQHLLGNTLPLIAGEKAGIIKAGVPVVVGEYQPEIAPVFEAKARELQSRLTFASRHYRVVETDTSAVQHTTYRTWRGTEPYLNDLVVNLRGPFQPRNLATLLGALEALEKLEMYQFEEISLRYALRHLRRLTNYQGRWQVLSESPLTITDSAHNEEGLRLVLAALNDLAPRGLHLVLGMVQDKDLSQILPLFPPAARYYFARPAVPRGLVADELRDRAATYGLRGDSYPSVVEAWRAARVAAGEEEVIFIGGSTFVVAEVI
ncbi:MAG: folylpolyglutamate synthase/dihydrofolate synthase family protein [Bacteroidota bacterium]